MFENGAEIEGLLLVAKDIRGFSVAARLLSSSIFQDGASAIRDLLIDSISFICGSLTCGAAFNLHPGLQRWGFCEHGVSAMPVSVFHASGVVAHAAETGLGEWV